MKKRVFRIGGMSCAACVGRIENAVKGLPGVIDASANIGNNTLSIEYDESTVSEKDIIARITGSGYTVISDDRDSAEREELRSLRIQSIDLVLAIMFTIPLFILAMGPMLGFDPGMDRQTHYLLQLTLVIPVLFAGRRFYTKGLRALASRNPTMDSLVALSTLASIALGMYDVFCIHVGHPTSSGHLYFDSAAMIITLVSVGKYIESRSKHRTNDSVRNLLSICPTEATVIRDGVEERILASELRVGDIVIVRPGETIPGDGTVTVGSSHVDESMLTGESMPV